MPPSLKKRDTAKHRYLEGSFMVICSMLRYPVLAAVALVVGLRAQQPPAQIRLPQSPDEADDQLRSTYVMGPEDEIAVWALEVEELAGKPVRIGANGDIYLPLLGPVRAAGLTVEQLRVVLTEKLKTYMHEPQVVVSISEMRSQPVSVMGAVNVPGIHQLQGRKTLIEILSTAGGVRADAGSSIKITRRLEWGRIPLRGANDDATGRFSVAPVSLKGLMEATNPEENILIRPHDVIAVPRAEMVYVIGDVPRPGGFVLNERENMTVLQALSLAGGVTRTSAPHRAKVLRAAAGATKRTELPVDLKEILAGKANDMALQPEDILFVPSSAGKSVALRSLETALGMGASIGTGVAIYRR